ncbi:HNH endonuclease [Streptomyces sennicomposti]
MTLARLEPPAPGRTALVARTVAGYRPSAVRAVPRPMRTTPSLRPPEPPLYPSRRDVLRRWEEDEAWSCVYCDSAFTQKVVAEVDHIRPLARGGVHEWPNLAPACAPCNRAKADLDVVDWLS